MKFNYPFKGLAIVMPFLFFSLLPCFTSAQPDCNNLINGGFEDWNVPAGTIGFFNSSNGWNSNLNAVEIWGSGAGGVFSAFGVDFLELNSNGPDLLWQDVATSPGAAYAWTVVHMGRSGVDVANLEFGPPGGPFTTIEVMTDGTGAWGFYSGGYIVPAGQTTTRLQFRSISTAGCGSCGNFLDGFHFGTFDCCPNDPNKTSLGQCGCGVADTDRDSDGTADCVDGCPEDAGKVAAGQCGCGVADTDTDSDGTADCNDGCPDDANKTSAGICGCGVADTDTDGDGTADCNDGCPDDANKTDPGACGCGTADTDTDGDGVADCNDNCINSANGDQGDSDCDGSGNVCDVCPGGNDAVDNNHDGLPDCHFLPAFNDIIAAWKCGNNKVLVAHHTGNGSCHTICVSYNAVQAHINHGDYVGPCDNSICNDDDYDDGLVIPNYHSSPISQADLEVFPNPAGDEVNIQLNIQGGAGTTVTISDNFGRIILTQQWEEGRHNQSIDVSTNHFVNGIYYVVASTDKQVLVQRFVISK